MLQEDVKLHVIPFACQAQPVLPYVLENVLETPMTAHKRRIFVDRLHTDIPAARPSQQRLPHASSRRMQRVVKRIFLPALVLLMVRPLYKQQRQKHTLQA